MASLVGPDGDVLGVENGITMIGEALRRSIDASLPRL